MLDEPSDAGISNYMRTRRAYLGAEAEVVEEVDEARRSRFRPGGHPPRWTRPAARSWLT